MRALAVDAAPQKKHLKYAHLRDGQMQYEMHVHEKKEEEIEFARNPHLNNRDMQRKEAATQYMRLAQRDSPFISPPFLYSAQRCGELIEHVHRLGNDSRC